MENLIKALQIFVKYENHPNPTHCEQGELWVVGITKEQVSDEDIKALRELGFFGTCDGCFKSFKYGSV